MFKADTKKLDAALKEEVVAETAVFDGRLMHVRRLEVRLPNGKLSTREMTRHCGAAAIVTLDEHQRVVLERQWRAPAGGAFWEIPAGKIDPGEEAFATARRELEEEAGLTAKRWTFLGTIHNAIGYSDEHIEIYLAREFTAGTVHLDDNEFLTLVKPTFEEALQMCRTGEITDVKTLAGLYWVRDYLAGKLPQALELSALS